MGVLLYWSVLGEDHQEDFDCWGYKLWEELEQAKLPLAFSGHDSDASPILAWKYSSLSLGTLFKMFSILVWNFKPEHQLHIWYYSKQAGLLVFGPGLTKNQVSHLGLFMSSRDNFQLLGSHIVISLKIFHPSACNLGEFKFLNKWK